MTPAIKLLEKQKICHQVLSYEHEASAESFGLEAAESFGLEAAEKLGLQPALVFKTLLAFDGQSFFVAILPVDHRLNLKKLASAVGSKKLQMAAAADAERVTGYIVGGISPLAQKKRLKTVIHSSAEDLDQMYVSGGKRGCDIGISPKDLAALLSATFVDIVE